MTEAAAAGGGDNGATGAGTAAIAAAGAATPDWISTIPENARDYVVNKGWKSPTDILTGYQNLESKLGANRVALPKEGDAASEAEWRKAIGVPEAADKYMLKLPDGAPVDEAFLNTAKAWFHEAGLTPKQAQALASKWTEYGVAATTEQAQARLKASEGELEAVKKEWGKEADANLAAAQRAFRAVQKPANLDAADLDKMEDALGTAKFTKMMAFFGSMSGEHRYVDGSMPAGTHFTPEAARARINELKNDRGWFAKFQAGDIAAQTEWKNLQAAAAAALS